jgi:hypothetical protein
MHHPGMTEAGLLRRNDVVGFPRHITAAWMNFNDAGGKAFPT